MVLALALPDRLDGPPQLLQFTRLAQVPLPIRRDLGRPEGGIRLCLNTPVRAVMPVPEAAVHEDGRAASRSDDVGTARQVCRV